MTVLTVFLRNLAAILVVGGIGYGLLVLPFSPVLIGGGYALLLAGLMTWSELAHRRTPPRGSSPARAAASKPGKRRASRETGEAPDTTATDRTSAPGKRPAAPGPAATPPRKRQAKPAVPPDSPPGSGPDRARQ